MISKPIIYTFFLFLIFSSYHLVARAKACLSDYRAALAAERTAFGIYSSKVHNNVNLRNRFLKA